MEFSHPCFQRDNPYLLEHIKRKISSAKTTTTPDDQSLLKTEVVTKVLHEVKQVKGRQDSLDSRFVSMKQENEALWREVAILRQKHMKQQQIVNKLIQFLVTIVQPQRGSGIGSMGGVGGVGGVKRRFQLMINDVPETAAKTRKTSRRSSVSSTGGGPVIHELTEELLDYDEHDDDVSSPYILSPGAQRQSVHDVDEIEDVHEDLVSYVDDNDSITFTEEDESDANVTAGPSTSDNGNTNVTQKARIKPTISYVIEKVDNSNVGQHSSSGKQFRLLQKKPTATATTKGQEVKILPIRTANIFKNSPTNVVNKVPVATVTSGGKSLLVNQANRAPAPVNIVTAAKVNMPSKSVGKVIMGSKYLAPTTTTTTTTAVNSPSTIADNSVSKTKKSYTNKNDFISTEMPPDLFEDVDQVCSPCT